MQDVGLYIVKRDLRIHDNAALRQALLHPQCVIAFIYEEGRFGGASKWWLHHALNDFSQSLTTLGQKLIIRSGAFEQEVEKLVLETKATAVYWSRDYEPTAYERDQRLGAALTKSGLKVCSFEGSLLLPPWTVQKTTGEGYKVFTPYYKQFLKQVIPTPLSVPKHPGSATPLLAIDTLSVDDLKLLPTIPWDQGFSLHRPSEEAALQVLDAFLTDKLFMYEKERDTPSQDATSNLSVYLAFGQLSPRMIWHRLLEPEWEELSTPFLRQLVWREFSYHLLLKEPLSLTEPLNQKFRAFPWEMNEDLFRCWAKGMTGYPIVDAGMRELWQTGFMHNRVRMIVASFLTKHLLIPWQKGAEWFMDTLVDADIANNTFGWQWVAGTGADAAPYFRIFNPTLQGQKFDPHGDYVKKWIPELSSLPEKYIHEPWKAPDSIQQASDFKLGATYPLPVIEHKQARERALERYAQIK